MTNSNLAICFIAGNEERVIERALDAAFSVTPNVVVVRAIGGSTPDKTLELAKSRGCVVGEYSNHLGASKWPFVDDFAAARNMSFRLGAEIVGKDGWLMWMDCDDILSLGAGEAINKVLNESKEHWILAEYNLPAHGKSVWRERIFRVGSAAWINAAHEKCIPLLTAEEEALGKETLSIRISKTFSVVHAPEDCKTGSQERNINILRWKDEETQHIKFYLHYEHFLLNKREEAVRYGLEALRMGNLCPVYRYEVLLNLGLLAPKNEHGQDLLRKAIALNQYRREAYGLLASLQMDAQQFEDAIQTCTQLLAIPEPKIVEWTHRPDMYGWKGYALLAWAHRLAGHEETATDLERQMLEKGGRPRISLLHATRGRWAQAITAMNQWLVQAKDAFHVEHIFAIDEDDVESREKLRRFRCVLSKPSTYSVGAWNAAAEKATGDILIQMSDDFVAPAQWDESIVKAFGGRLFGPSVLRVSDGCRTDGLITMAIVTQAWYERHGLFHSAYKNVYSDTDLTAVATKENAIIEAPHILMKHQHPFFNKSVPMDATYERGNDLSEYERAKKIFEARHPQN